MPVTPPLDKIPKIPALAVNQIMQVVSNQVDALQEKSIQAIEQTALPDSIDCDDPRVQSALEAFEELNRTINTIRSLIPIVQRVTTVVSTLVTTANAIKTAQLLNPVTAPAVIAAELVIVQNMTIANATIALEQFKNIPNLIENSILGLQPTLLEIASKLSTVCSTEDLQFNIDNLDSTNQIDISELDDTLSQQQDLLTSLEEAPSKVFKDNGDPDANIGKPGDYYIDLQNKLIYGPKPTRASWGDGVNYE